MDTSEQVQSPEEDFELPQELTTELTQKRRSQGRIIFDRFVRNRAATVGAVFLVIMVLCCLIIPFIPGHTTPDAVGQTTPFAGISWQYPFGADNLGRDTFARAMIGGRISLLVALSSMLISILLGTLIGALAGYYGGWIDNILMRLTDTILTIPLYLLLFVLSATFADGTPTSVILLIAVFGWTTSARLVRGEFLSLKQREFVQAATTIGARGPRLMFYHILPNAAGPIIVNATLLVGSNIILESVLSFFGFGVSIPVASWGSMINQGRDYFDSSPRLILIPGILIFLTVLSCNLVGDGLRDALDPHMTER
ncbi:ABC transporter permease [Dictyobacter kobayashii]|uniref:Oligopeptide transport system permease protein AppC n=1 Tax=Dictyobacter kobayashii TaxID=2014872 RepID=A0A402AEU9_9CHLR|nr:ABC transporter permease [Dictyobacter kobayashii]GCE17629.1 oligopeptide transport system permease protein AppC [Dictyobacter kobayashii]